MKKLEGYAALAEKKGAAAAKMIESSSIKVSEWVRWKCRYGCPGYGKTLTCPPFSSEPGPARRVVRSCFWAASAGRSPRKRVPATCAPTATWKGLQ